MFQESNRIPMPDKQVNTFSRIKAMLNLNKQLTALALLTLSSVAGTMLTISNASAGPKQPDTVKDVTLKDQSGREFSSNDGVADLSKVGFDNKAVFAAVNNGQAWRFYDGKNFKGEFIQIGPDQAQGLGKFSNKVSSFCSVGKCPK